MKMLYLPILFKLNISLRGSLRLPREAAAAPSAGPLQRAGAARGERERSAAALLRPHAHADH